MIDRLGGYFKSFCSKFTTAYIHTDNPSLDTKIHVKSALALKDQEPDVKHPSLTQRKWSLLSFCSYVIKKISHVALGLFSRESPKAPGEFDKPVQPSNSPVVPLSKKVQKPKGIPNSGNQCYRIATNQALFSMVPFIELLKRENHFTVMEGCELKEVKAKQSIKSSLLALYNALNEKSESEILQLDKLLGNEIANSKLAPDINNSTLSEQQDAAVYLELLLGQVLQYSIEVSTTCYTVFGGELFEKSMGKDTYPVMQVPLRENVNDLQTLVDMNFFESVNDLDNVRELAAGKSFSQYDQKSTILGKPKSFLPIQLKRFAYDPEVINRAFTTQLQAFNEAGVILTEAEIKDLKKTVSEMETGIVLVDRPIKFPAGNVLDMSKAYNLQAGELTYHLQAFVCHDGESANHGHYISYIRQGDQWFCCDDNCVNSVEESVVNKKKEQAYLLFFENDQNH